MCPVGVLQSQSLPVSNMVTTIIGANLSNLMEGMSNLLEHLKDNVECKGGSNLEKLDMLPIELRSMRIIMHCLRIISLLCRRCPRQMKSQYRLIIMSTLHVYLIMRPLPVSLKDDNRQESKNSTEASADNMAAKHCAWLWRSVVVTCKAVHKICPDDWSKVTSTLFNEDSLATTTTTTTKV